MSNPLPQSGGSYTLKRGKLQKVKTPKPQKAEAVETSADAEKLTETKEAGNGK